MKRLIRKAFGTILYHGTTLSSLESIVKDGMILPQERKGGGQNPDNPLNYDGFTFVSNDIELARRYGDVANRNYEDIAVLELDLPKSSLLPDDNDCPECKTVEESLEKIKQAKVLGSITSDYIRKVYFYNSEGKFLFDTNFIGCLEAYKDYNKNERDWSNE